MISDKELVSLLCDPTTRSEGFSAMVRQYSEQLYWKVRHIVLNHDDTDDVLQNTFLKENPLSVLGSIASPSTSRLIF